MTNKDIAKILEEISKLLEIQGENPFKVIAYANAARTIEGFPEDIKKYYEEKRLQEIKGIGKSIAEKIGELYQTGKIDFYESLKQTIAPGLLQMLKIPGLGPKKIKVLHEKLDINTIEELEYACNENRLITLDGFGQKTQDKIKHGITLLAQYKDKHLLSEIYPIAHNILDYIKKCHDAVRSEIAGSLRRWKEVVKDIDIVVSADKLPEIIDYCSRCPYISELIERGENEISFYSEGIRVDIKFVKTEQYACAIMHFTGSKDHNVELRKIARQRSLKINEYGVFQEELRMKINTEEEFYAFFNMQYIPPELREGMGEVDAALKHQIPELVSPDEIIGFVHMHTNWSDGTPQIDEVAEEAVRRGYKYIGIADHSKAAQYAGGLDENRVLEQIKTIDQVNKKYKKVRLLKGIEADVLKDGQIDLDESVLKQLDYVIASVHSSFSMTEEEMTERMLKALRNPYVNILGHPSGRLLLGREPYKVNMDTILKEAIKLGKIIELNANPFRLDIDWRYLYWNHDTNLRIMINPDAHHLGGIDDMMYGIAIARKGWMRSANVLNTLDADTLLSLFAEQRKTKY